MPEKDTPQAALRASDADRDRIAGLLGEALADGRLTDEEHRQRLDHLYASKTHGDLVPLTSDLGAEVAPRQGRQPVPVERVHPQVAILSSSMARPTGLVQGRMVATGLFGSPRIDLSHATIDDDGVEIVGYQIVT